MMYLIICIGIPLFIGILLLIFSSNQNRSAILLFHDLTSNKFSRSLSEFPISKFNKFIKNLKLNSISPIRFSERDSIFDERLSLIFDDGLHSNIAAAQILHEHEMYGSFFVCTGPLNNEQIADVYKSKEWLQESEIQEISRLGHEIGSHTIHHYDLRLLSEVDLKHELSDSKKTLELLIQKKVTSLSMPYGLWNDNIIRVAKECGYTTFAVYNFPKQAYSYNRVFPVTGIYPFDSIDDLMGKVSRKHTVSSVAARIVPLFAKGSPLGSFQSVYKRLPFPWFMNRKEQNKANYKEERE